MKNPFSFYKNPHRWKTNQYNGTTPSAIPWSRTRFFLFVYKMFLLLFYETLWLIHIDLHLQYSITKCCFYIHLVDFPIHGHCYCENAYIGDKFGHMDKDLIESQSGHLKILFATNNTSNMSLYGAEYPFVSYTLAIIWKVVQFPQTIGHELVIYFLHYGLSSACIFIFPYFAGIQKIIQKCHIVPFFAK